MKKVLLISSQGGHWIQLKRLLPVFKNDNLYMASTFKNRPVLPDEVVEYCAVCDASRWNKFKLIQQAYQVYKVVLHIKPDIIFTTGASVGIWAIVAGKICGAKTIWLDSIANYEKISLSGRIARLFVDKHITQWAHLANNKTAFKGSVI